MNIFLYKHIHSHNWKTWCFFPRQVLRLNQNLTWKSFLSQGFMKTLMLNLAQQSLSGLDKYLKPVGSMIRYTNHNDNTSFTKLRRSQALISCMSVNNIWQDSNTLTLLNVVATASLHPDSIIIASFYYENLKKIRL